MRINQLSSMELRQHRTQNGHGGVYLSAANFSPAFRGVGADKFVAEAVSLAKKGYQLSSNGKSFQIILSGKSSLGSEPCLFYSCDDAIKQIPAKEAERFGMDANYKAKWAETYGYLCEYCGKYMFFPDEDKTVQKFNYAIYYQDTKKWDDNGGKGYTVPVAKMVKKALAFDAKTFKHPLIRVLKYGSGEAKVVVGKTVVESISTLPKNNEPVLLVVEDLGELRHFEAFGYIPKNVKGVVLTKSTYSALGHEVASLRNGVNSLVMLFDDKKAEAIQKMSGQFVKFDINPKGLRYKSIAPSEIKVQEIKPSEIKIPQLKPVDRILSSSEYAPDVMAPKAFRIGVMESMKKRGKLKDILIPQSFGLPTGIFDKIMAANPNLAKIINETEKELDSMEDLAKIGDKLAWLRSEIASADRKMKIPEDIVEEIVAFRKKMGLDEYVITRSAFNGEDAKGYSATGLYDSRVSCGKKRYKDDESRMTEELLNRIKEVFASKWSYRAYMSRRGNNIAHDTIKPTMIIQDYLQYAEYKFTLYTKSPLDKSGNKVLIQMDVFDQEQTEPCLITYSRKTGDVEIFQRARKILDLDFDDKARILPPETPHDPILANFDKYKVQIKKICKAALELEDEFKAPQDVEGGIKLGENGDIETSKLYFWQTRDQVE